MGGTTLQKIDVLNSVDPDVEIRISSRFLPQITASGGAVEIQLQTDRQITIEIDNHNLSLNHDFQFRNH